MPIYRYSHTCGMEQDVHRSVDKENVLVDCARCGRNVMAKQVRDKNITLGEADGTIGVLRRERSNQKPRRR